MPRRRKESSSAEDSDSDSSSSGDSSDSSSSASKSVGRDHTRKERLDRSSSFSKSKRTSPPKSRSYPSKDEKRRENDKRRPHSPLSDRRMQSEREDRRSNRYKSGRQNRDQEVSHSHGSASRREKEDRRDNRDDRRYVDKNRRSERSDRDERRPNTSDRHGNRDTGYRQERYDRDQDSREHGRRQDNVKYFRHDRRSDRDERERSSAENPRRSSKESTRTNNGPNKDTKRGRREERPKSSVNKDQREKSSYERDRGREKRHSEEKRISVKSKKKDSSSEDSGTDSGSDRSENRGKKPVTKKSGPVLKHPKVTEDISSDEGSSPLPSKSKSSIQETKENRDRKVIAPSTPEQTSSSEDSSSESDPSDDEDSNKREVLITQEVSRLSTEQVIEDVENDDRCRKKELIDTEASEEKRGDTPEKDDKGDEDDSESSENEDNKKEVVPPEEKEEGELSEEDEEPGHVRPRPLIAMSEDISETESELDKEPTEEPTEQEKTTAQNNESNRDTPEPDSRTVKRVLESSREETDYDSDSENEDDDDSDDDVRKKKVASTVQSKRQVESSVSVVRQDKESSNQWSPLKQDEHNRDWRDLRSSDERRREMRASDNKRRDGRDSDDRKKDSRDSYDRRNPDDRRDSRNREDHRRDTRDFDNRKRDFDDRRRNIRDSDDWKRDSRGSDERRREERDDRRDQRERDQGQKRRKEDEPSSAGNEAKRAKTDDGQADPTTGKKAAEDKTVDLLNRTGGAYIPPARLRMMQAQITDKTSAAYQRMSWEALKKSINGLINKVNVSNLTDIVRELFQENIVRGRGLLARSIIQAQAASPTFTHVYAALVAIINSKFPQNGELILRRLILTFRRGYKRNNKSMCLTSTQFVAHLVNQQVAHEVIALEILTLLLETPTDDSVEVAIGFLKESGQKLTDVSPRGMTSVFERLRHVLNESKLDIRVQYMIEVMYAIRKDKFKDHQSVLPELDLVEEEDQFTHLLQLQDAINGDEMLNVFKEDPNFAEGEEKYKSLKREILEEGSSDEGSEGSVDSSSSDSDDDNEDEEKKTQIIDQTESNLVALRRTIYLTIQSSLDHNECAHKMLKMELKPGQEVELCNMILDCGAQHRTYEKFFGLLAERFCQLDKKYIAPFQQAFIDQYETVHRLETNKLRIVAKFFAHLLYTDAISWGVLSVVKLTETDTTSASRIFLKTLFQELSEYMGLVKLVDRLKDPTLQSYFEGIMPRSNPNDTRFAINFFTTIGLGGLTDDLRDHLKNVTKLMVQQKQEEETKALQTKRADSSSDSDSDSDTDSDSSDSDSDSSSDPESSPVRRKKSKISSKKQKKSGKDGKNKISDRGKRKTDRSPKQSEKSKSQKESKKSSKSGNKRAENGKKASPQPRRRAIADRLLDMAEYGVQEDTGRDSGGMERSLSRHADEEDSQRGRQDRKSESKGDDDDRRRDRETQRNRGRARDFGEDELRNVEKDSRSRGGRKDYRQASVERGRGYGDKSREKNGREQDDGWMNRNVNDRRKVQYVEDEEDRYDNRRHGHERRDGVQDGKRHSDDKKYLKERNKERQREEEEEERYEKWTENGRRDTSELGKRNHSKLRSNSGGRRKDSHPNSSTNDDSDVDSSPVRKRSRGDREVHKSSKQMAVKHKSSESRGKVKKSRASSVVSSSDSDDSSDNSEDERRNADKRQNADKHKGKAKGTSKSGTSVSRKRKQSVSSEDSSDESSSSEEEVQERRIIRKQPKNVQRSPRRNEKSSVVDRDNRRRR